MIERTSDGPAAMPTTRVSGELADLLEQHGQTTNAASLRAQYGLVSATQPARP